MSQTQQKKSEIAEMYPGIYRPERDGDDGPNLPTQPLNTLLGFDLETYQIPIDDLMPCKKVPDGVMSTRKYRQIVSSIREIGIIGRFPCCNPIQPNQSTSCSTGTFAYWHSASWGATPYPACLPRMTKPTPTTTGSTGFPPSRNTT